MGFLIGIFGISFSIYISYFQDTNPKIRYDIITNTSIIDVKEDVGNLDITFNGNSVTKNNTTLRIITVRVTNPGNRNILKSDYDIDSPLGFSIEDGIIVEPPVLIDSSSKYLKDSLRVSVATGKVYFSNIILEKNEYFVVKVLVIADKSTIPHVVPSGKVAGVKEILVVDAETAQTDEGFLKKVYYGNFFIQVVRSVTYPFSLGFMIFIIVLPYSSITDYLGTRKRRKIISKFKQKLKVDCGKIYELLFSYYEKNNEVYLSRILMLITNEQVFKNEFRETCSGESRHGLNMRDRDLENFFERPPMFEYRIIRTLINDGMVKEQEGNFEINQEFKESISKFLEYINYYL